LISCTRLAKSISANFRARRVRKARQFFNSVRFEVGDVAIDCGANVGKVTEKLVDRGATVYAFEPNPYAFERLQEKFKSNPRVFCLNQAVLDYDGEAILYFHKSSDEDEVKYSQGSSLVVEKPNVRSDKRTKVEVIDLTKFIANLNSQIRLVKIDVEGVEDRIVTALVERGTIRKIDFVFVETHERKIPELVAPIKRLKKLLRENCVKNVNLDWR